MGKGILTETGRLQDKLLPAIYFDSSVVIDYWMSEEWTELDLLGFGGGKDYWVQEGLVKFQKEEWVQHHEDLLSQKREYIKKLLKADVRLSKVAEIRQKLNSGKAKATAVISPPCLLELAEWYAEARFKQVASEAAGVMFIQKRSKKEIGGYLSKIFTGAIEEEFSKTEEIKSEGVLFLETFLPSLVESKGLKGLVQADIVNFCLSSSSTLYQTPSIYAYIQVGAIDIIHILLAHHLGCKYIASFDTDFQRARQVIYLKTKMKLLSSPEEILEIL